MVDPHEEHILGRQARPAATEPLLREEPPRVNNTRISAEPLDEDTHTTINLRAEDGRTTIERREQERGKSHV